MHPESILFVCTGNTCRSIIAERVAKKIFEEEGLSIKVDSAGTFIMNKTPLLTYQILKEEGLDSTPHEPKSLKDKRVKDYTLVLVMEKAHKEYIKRVFGRDEGVHLLTEDAGEEGEIPDPYGGCIESYRECLQRIKGCIKRMVERWKLLH